MTENGDDIPPGLATRLKEEEFTADKVAGMLTKHFTGSANGKKKDPMAELIIRTILNRMDRHELLEMLAERQGRDNSGPDVGPA